MSLHRDPTHYSNNPVEIHIRRLIWFQICFLDLRTCEATGPRPQIRREEYDTKFPLNVDDVDLEKGVEVTEDRKYFTDMTITRMRFECYEMHRMLWIERPKLEAKKTTLTSLLSKIKSFCQAMEKTYLPILQKTHPLHVLAMEIYGILSCRMYLMVLQKFVSNHQRLMPERLRQITISTAVMVLEHSMTLEQTPALADWSWYIGAYHQYHTALLLISELYAKERQPDLEARAWRCLDFVFDLPAALSGAEKTRMVLEELVGRTETYSAIRRVRAPAKMEHPGPRVHGVEYQRQQAELERERRSSSVQSGNSNYSLSSSSSQAAQPQMANIGQIAQMDFGAAYAPGMGTAETSGTEYQNFTAFTSSGGGQPGIAFTPSPLPSQGQSGTVSESGSSTGPNVGVIGTGGSPMDVMPEIDWVSEFFLEQYYLYPHYYDGLPPHRDHHQHEHH
jgi:hypothetical protein